MLKEKTKRLILIDEIRGIDIILICSYHLLYDLVWIFNYDIPWFKTSVMSTVQVGIAGVFVLISGMMCRFSHNNALRGARCLALGMGLTLVTYFVLPSEFIAFGILHMLGICMLAFALIAKLIDRLPAHIGAALCAALFCLTYYTQLGYWGIGSIRLALPKLLYELPLMFTLGFPGAGFVSSDYFPLLPWMFLFLCGAYLGTYAKKGSLPAFCYSQHSRALCFLGRHTLIIYLVHQPIIYGILLLAYSIT